MANITTNSTQREITICFDLNTPCSDLRIEWLSREGIMTKCKDGNCYTIKLDPYSDSKNKCLEGWAYCEGCISCEPIYFNKCFCDNQTDCLECQTCNQEKSICVDICSPEEIAQGKVCTSDGCNCPPDKPFFDIKINECAECLSGTINPDDPCIICVDGKWTEKKCPNGVCADGKCAQCKDSGDCASNTDGRTRCNGDNKCGCEDGFYYSYTEKRCVKNPECSGNEIIDNCFQCVDGKLVKIQCADDKICIPGIGCVKRCDCDSKIGCDDKSACVYTEDGCFCKECTMNENGDCSTGCYKDADGICRPNPCKGSCNDGTDCGPKCGCNEITKQCEPCDKYKCSECGVLMGCKCDDLNKCSKDTRCNKPCVTKYDCDSNCTCDKGDCISCGNFESESDCSDKTCKDKFELKLDKENCESDCDGSPCNLVAELTKTECCSCPELTLQVQLKSATEYNDTIDGRPIKGTKLAYQLSILKDGLKLSNSDVENESLKTSGSVKVVSTSYYTVNGVKGQKTISSGVTSLIDDNDTYTLNEVPVYNPNFVINEAGYKLVIDRVELRIELVSDLEFYNNCTYKSGTVTTFTYTNPNFSVLESKTVKIQSDDCRLPIFNFYRSSSASNSSAGSLFKQIYVEESNIKGIYKHTLKDCKDELYSSYTYQVDSDCSCSRTEPVKALFCDDFAGFDYDIIDCGKRLKVNKNFIPCDVNQDLSKQGCTNYPEDAQVKWILKLNGEVVNGDGWVLDSTGMIGVGGYQTKDKSIIKTIEIVSSHNKDCKLMLDNNADKVGYDVSVSCDDGGSIIVKNKSNQSGTVNLISAIDVSIAPVNNTLPANGEIKFKNLGQNSSFNLTITIGSCVFGESNVTTPDDCCKSDFKIEKVEEVDGKLKLVTSPPLTGSGSYNVTVNNLPYTISGGIIQGLAVEENKQYNIVISDDNGCSAKYTYKSNCVDFRINGIYDCDTNTLKLTTVSTGSTAGTPSNPIIYEGNEYVSGDWLVFAYDDFENKGYELPITSKNGCNGELVFTKNCQTLTCFKQDMSNKQSVLSCNKNGVNAVFTFSIELDELLDLSNCKLQLDNPSLQLDSTGSLPANYVDSYAVTYSNDAKTTIKISCKLNASINMCNEDIYAATFTGSVKYIDEAGKTCLCKNKYLLENINISNDVDVDNNCCGATPESQIDISWTEEDCEFTFAILNFTSGVGYNISVEDELGFTVYSSTNEVTENPSPGKFKPTTNGTYTVNVTDNGSAGSDVETMIVDCVTEPILLDVIDSECNGSGDHIIHMALEGGNCSGNCEFIVNVHSQDNQGGILVYSGLLSFNNYNPSGYNTIDVTIPSDDVLSPGDTYYITIKKISNGDILDTGNVPTPECDACLLGDFDLTYIETIERGSTFTTFDTQWTGTNTFANCDTQQTSDPNTTGINTSAKIYMKDGSIYDSEVDTSTVDTLFVNSTNIARINFHGLNLFCNGGTHLIDHIELTVTLRRVFTCPCAGVYENGDLPTPITHTLIITEADIYTGTSCP